MLVIGIFFCVCVVLFYTVAAAVVVLKHALGSVFVISLNCMCKYGLVVCCSSEMISVNSALDLYVSNVQYYNVNWVLMPWFYVITIIRVATNPCK
jgi:hypothetical protein